MHADGGSRTAVRGCRATDPFLGGGREGRLSTVEESTGARTEDAMASVPLILTTLETSLLERHPAVPLDVAACWEGLRRDLGLARLELRVGGRVPLAAPNEHPRRVDGSWLRRLAPESFARRAAGTGPLAGLDLATAAWARGDALAVAQAAVGEPLPGGALLARVARLGVALLRAQDDELDLRRARQLARLGARAGGRLHDLRNQLTLALFRADVAARDDGERARTARGELVEDLRRARELAADGIVLQRAEERSDGPDVESSRSLRRIPLRALLSEEARALAATSRAAGARVRARCPVELEVLGESVALGRLVRNLLLNAAESRPGGVTITVDVARARGSRLGLVITDDGVGMDSEGLAGYLEAGRTVGGSGFGTASVREALERLDGELTVTSTPGRGTRVELGLWAAPPAGSAPVIVVAPTAVVPNVLAGGMPTDVVVTSPLRALSLVEGLAPTRIELHRAALGPGRRQLVRAAARLGVPVIERSAREGFTVAIPE